MPLEQTLVSPSRNLFPYFPQNPFRINRLSAVSQFLNPQFRCCLQFSSNLKRRRFVEPVKYSVDYAEHGYGHQAAYPKPEEIPWRKELCNRVHLIGTVGTTVEIKHLASGKVVASTRLAVRKSPTDTTWINLIFWDELAHIAFQHIEKGHQIYISGRLVSDTVESNEGKQQTYYKVVVQQLNLIERNSSSLASNGGSSNFMISERKYRSGTTNNSGSTEQLWQAFFANPLEWWDNRNNKKSPKYPDFKHKDTGEALWVEGRNNPLWVRSQLEVLDSRMGTTRDKDRRMPVSPMFADDIMPF